jgi:hypothetical protein
MQQNVHLRAVERDRQLQKNRQMKIAAKDGGADEKEADQMKADEENQLNEHADESNTNDAQRRATEN